MGSGDSLPTDLTPLDNGPNINVLRRYFQDISFRDLPNILPMSWSANGINSAGQITGVVTRNKGTNSPGSNAYYAARWQIGDSLDAVKILGSLPNVPEVEGFDGAAYAISEPGIVAGTMLKAVFGFGADQRNQTDHLHAFSSLSPLDGPVDLMTGGGWHSEGWAVNALGQVAGVTTISEDDPYWRTQAFITASFGTAIDGVLPTLKGVSSQFLKGYGFAKAVNNNGWVVGQSMAHPSYDPPGRYNQRESYGCLWKKDASGNYEVVPMHYLTPGSGWVYDIGTCINQKNVIGGTGFYQPSTGAPYSAIHSAVLLIPAEIVPDRNRDGVIDEFDSGRIGESYSWRWWLNDDCGQRRCVG